MQGRAISLVRGESILWILAVQLDQKPVARYLRDDGRGADGRAEPVAVDNAALGVGDIRNVNVIDKDELWRWPQREHRLAHRQARRLENVDTVDQLDIRDPDADGDGTFEDSMVDALPLSGCEALGVVDSLDGAGVRENDGGGDDRSGKWPAASLVDAGDLPMAGRPECILRAGLKRGIVSG